MEWWRWWWCVVSRERVEELMQCDAKCQGCIYAMRWLCVTIGQKKKTRAGRERRVLSSSHPMSSRVLFFFCVQHRKCMCTCMNFKHKLLGSCMYSRSCRVWGNESKDDGGDDDDDDDGTRYSPPNVRRGYRRMSMGIWKWGKAYGCIRTYGTFFMGIRRLRLL